MSATAPAPQAWETFDDQVGSVLDSIEECVELLSSTPAGLGPSTTLVALPPTTAWIADRGGRTQMPVLDLRAGKLLPADLCRRLRMLPVSSNGHLRLVVDTANIELRLGVLRRHPATRAAKKFDFAVIGPQDLDALIELVHGPETPSKLIEVLGELDVVPAERAWSSVPTHAPAIEGIDLELDGIEPEPELAEEVPLTHAGAAAEPRSDMIGSRLIAAGIVTAGQLEAALELQAQYGGMLGEILIAELGADEHAVFATLADQLGLSLMDLRGIKPSDAAVARVGEQLMREHRVIPLELTPDLLTVGMVDPLDEAAIAALHAATGMTLRRVMVTDSGFDQAFQRLFTDAHADRAVNLLLEERPQESAKQTLTRPQKLVGIVVAVLAVLALLHNPIQALVIFNVIAVVFYLSFAAYRLKLVYNSLARDAGAGSERRLEPRDELRLPVFTLLVPLYHEAEIVYQLADGIAGLDYPKTKLDVKLICEADDLETIAAIEALGLPPYFRLVVVPDGQPKTKPKACNYALMQARGELVVIFDAEDRPDPDQLRRVVAAFAASDPHVVCVQCKLSYFNRDQNLLTRWFTTEYSMWFDLFLPGLDSVDAPIPLGGTSNHFVTAQLRELGAWDPYNVTEDADLGIRLSKAGYRTTIVDSTTFEEANPVMSNWIRQRSRWVKGYIQTWLVHMRNPLRLARVLGWRRFWSFQFVVGGTFIGFLLNPLYWILTTLWMLSEIGLIREIFPGALFYAASAGLYIGNFMFMYLNAAGAMWRGYDKLVKYALFSPVYWGLMSIAAWKALFQLITKPHYWEKTVHGLARTPAHGALGEHAGFEWAERPAFAAAAPDAAAAAALGFAAGAGHGSAPAAGPSETWGGRRSRSRRPDAPLAWDPSGQWAESEPLLRDQAPAPEEPDNGPASDENPFSAWGF